MANKFSQLGYEPIVVTESADIVTRRHYETLKDIQDDAEILYENAMLVLETVATDIDTIRIGKNASAEEVNAKLNDAVAAAKTGMNNAESVTKKINIAAGIIKLVLVVGTMPIAIASAMTCNELGLSISYAGMILGSIVTAKGADVIGRKAVISKTERDDGYVVAVEAYCVSKKLIEKIDKSDMSASEKSKAKSSIETTARKLKDDILKSKDMRDDFKRSPAYGMYGGPEVAGAKSTIKSVEDVNKRIKSIGKSYDVDVKEFIVK